MAVLRVRSRKPVEEPTKSPLELFLEELQFARKDSGSDLKKFQSEVHRLLKELLASMFSIDADKSDDQQLINSLIASGISESKSIRIVGWLSKARKDKFAPIDAGPGETLRLETEIRNFFENWNK